MVEVLLTPHEWINFDQQYFLIENKAILLRCCRIEDLGVQGTFCCLGINIDLISLGPCGEMESFRSLLSKNLEALLNPNKAISAIHFSWPFWKLMLSSDDVTNTTEFPVQVCSRACCSKAAQRLIGFNLLGPCICAITSSKHENGDSKFIYWWNHGHK